MDSMDVDLKHEVTIKEESTDLTDFLGNELMPSSYVEVPDLITVIHNENGAEIVQPLANNFEQDIVSARQVEQSVITEQPPLEIPPLVTVVRNPKGETVVQKFVDPLVQIPKSDSSVELPQAVQSSFHPVGKATRSSENPIPRYRSKVFQQKPCTCCVCKLASKGITAFTEKERNSIIKAGRPTPELDQSKINKNKSENFTRNVQPNLYKIYPWLTGCKKTNKLYCWPCSLFQPKLFHQGFIELQYIDKCLKKHGNLESHLKVYIKERLLANYLAKEDIDIDANVQQHNELKKAMDTMDIDLKHEVTIKEESTDFLENESMPTSYVEVPDLITVIHNENGEEIVQPLENDFEQDIVSARQVEQSVITEEPPLEIPPLVTVVRNTKGETVVQNFVDPLVQVPKSNSSAELPQPMQSSFHPVGKATRSSETPIPPCMTKVLQQKACTCCVCKLASKGITAFTEKEKNSIIKAGRPTPQLDQSIINKNRSENFTRHWQPNLYKIYSWLTGCKETNKLYCWPCSLFQPIDKSKFLHQGFIELQYIHKCLKKHSNLESHLKVYVKERLLANKLTKEDIDIDVNVQQHNELVLKSRNVLKRLMNVMCFQAIFNVTPRGQINDNKCTTMDLIKLIANYDQSLLHEIESIPHFEENLSGIYKDLEMCLFNITLKEIRDELKTVLFASLIFYDILDNNNKNHLAAIVRYIKYISGKPVAQERFLGYIDIEPSDRNADVMVKIILNLIENLDCKEKIVSQSYCGAAIIPKQLGIVQSRIKQAHPTILFTYCSGFKLCEVLAQSLSTEIDICDAFFSEIRGMSELFLKYPKLTETLHIAINVATAPLSWKFNGELFKKLMQILPHILFTFRNVVNNRELWNTEIVNACRGYVVLLETDKKFNFLIPIFADVFCMVDDLMHEMKLIPHDVIGTCQKIHEVSKELAGARLKYKTYLSKSFPQENYEPPKKKSSSNLDFKELYFRVIENIIAQFRDQLKNYIDIKFTEYCYFKGGIVHSKISSQYTVILPSRSYMAFFDNKALLSQFQGLLNSTDMDLNKTPGEMLTFLKETGLDSGFNEIATLIELALTIPSGLGSNEELIFNLEKIKKYVRSCPDEKMALLAIEGNLIQKLTQNQKFYEDIFDMFVTASDKLKLHFK